MAGERLRQLILGNGSGLELGEALVERRAVERLATGGLQALAKLLEVGDAASQGAYVDGLSVYHQAGCRMLHSRETA